jgi:hypothetical protein
MTPYLLYFLIPVVERWQGLEGAKRAALLTICLVLIAASFFIHFRGATSWQVYRWNDQPRDVDKEVTRLWDWSDPPFLRGLLERKLP